MASRAEDWLRQALRDLDHARAALERQTFEWAAFAAQQAAEKAVKAVFQAMGAEAWGHAVADLLTELGQRHAVPDALVEGGLELDKAYIPTRYPNAHPSGAPTTRYTKGEATRLIGYADEIIRLCADLLSRLR